MQGRQEDNIADNGFMKQKAVKGLLSRCNKLLQESSQYKAFHFRIPICIGYSTDLEPVEFEVFVDQVQTIVDQMNREIEAKKPTSSDTPVFDGISQQETDSTLHEYTFYLYPNEYDSEKVTLWLGKNGALIEVLQRTGHLVKLSEMRSSSEWEFAKKQYEEFILTADTKKELPETSGDEKAKTKASLLLPSALLEEDAKRYLDSLKKQGKGQDVKLHDLVTITKDKVVDVLSWGIVKGAAQRASVVLHYATPSKAMLNVFPYQEHLGYVRHSSVYQEFKKNNIDNIKNYNTTPGVPVMPLVTSLKDGERFLKVGAHPAGSDPVPIP